MTLYFTAEHQWARLADDHASATIGISTHAQDALGDIVFLDLAPIGKAFNQFDVGATVESVKTAADVLMPLSGQVIEINEALRAEPSLANTDPLGAGWFMRIKTNPEQVAQELYKLIPESNYQP